jgi:hypothetical protein
MKMSEEKIYEREIKVKVKEKSNKVEIIIDDKDLVEYIHDWFDDYEIYFDTDVPDRPLLVIKFYLR